MQTKDQRRRKAITAHTKHLEQAEHDLRVYENHLQDPTLTPGKRSTWSRSLARAASRLATHQRIITTTKAKLIYG